MKCCGRAGKFVDRCSKYRVGVDEGFVLVVFFVEVEFPLVELGFTVEEVLVFVLGGERDVVQRYGGVDVEDS